jgi:hypothetical protein
MISKELIGNSSKGQAESSDADSPQIAAGRQSLIIESPF